MSVLQKESPEDIVREAYRKSGIAGIAGYLFSIQQAGTLRGVADLCPYGRYAPHNLSLHS